MDPYVKDLFVIINTRSSVYSMDSYLSYQLEQYLLACNSVTLTRTIIVNGHLKENVWNLQLNDIWRQ